MSSRNPMVRTSAPWKLVSLSEACSLVSRGTAPSYVEAGDVRAIGQRCVSKSGFAPKFARFHDFKPGARCLEAEPNDVLLNSTGTGTIGRSCVFPGGGHFIVDGHVTVLRPGPELDARWLEANLRHPDGQRHLEVSCYSGSTNQVELSRTALAGSSICLPPLPEQQLIASILDTVDEVIRKTEEVIAKLQQMKQGLLHDLLTRGIDDNGELRDPDRHPEQFKDSPLGRIPKDWEVGGLLDVGCQERQPILTGPFGAQLGSADFVDTGVPLLRIGNVQWGYLDLGDLKHVTPRKAESLSKYRVEVGDLLFARQGATTGRNALASQNADGFLINYHIIRVAFDRAKCHPTFIYAVFNSPIVQRQVDREKGRSTREGVSTGTLTSLLLPIPSVSEQDRLAHALERLDLRVGSEQAELAKLRLLKSGLMDDLLTGRVRVTDLLP